MNRVLCDRLRRVQAPLALGAVFCGCEQPLPNLATTTPDASLTAPSFVWTDAANSGTPPDAASMPPLPPSTEDTVTSERPGSNEPDRDPALTVMHAVADARLLYFCPGTETGDLDPAASPMPPGGLAYGQTWVRTEADLDFEAGLSQWVIAVDVALAYDVRCADVVVPPADAGAGRDVGVDVKGERDAAAPRLLDAATVSEAAVSIDASADASVPRDAALDAAVRDARAALPAESRDATLARDAAASAGDASVPRTPRVPRLAPFVTFPAGSFERAKSSLLIAAGCLGPVPLAHAGYCGTSHAVVSSLRPYWLPLSRVTAFDSIGLQFVNASDVESATLRSTPEEGTMGAYFSIGHDVGIGEIAPEALRTGVPVLSIGAELGQVQLEVDAGTGTEPVFSQSWQQTLNAASDVQFGNARAVSLVLIGPVTVPRNRAFNPPRLVLISNDPVRNAQ